MENIILNIRLMKHQIEMINSTIGYESEIIDELDRMVREIKNDVQKYEVHGTLWIAVRIAIEAATIAVVALQGSCDWRDEVGNDAVQLYKVAEAALNRYCGLDN